MTTQLRLLRTSDVPLIKAHHRRLFGFDLASDTDLFDAIASAR